MRIGRKQWVKPTLKIITAGSAEANKGGDVKDGVAHNSKS